MKTTAKQQMIQNLLHWYDQEGRDLPWRLHPRQRATGHSVDPYAVWLSEVMLQQTSVATVTVRFEQFRRRWPTVEILAAAADEDVLAEWAGLGYYARARNLLKCARRIMSQFNGEFPKDAKELETLPGIGPYTAAAISSIAFDCPAAAVDGNIERVLARLFVVKEPLPKAKTQIRQHASELCPETRAGDWHQALMDLGAMVCKPRNPKCEICPLTSHCLAFKQGIQETLPKKASRRRRVVQYGILYVGRRQGDGAWLLEQRPNQGLFGGMLGWPGSDWGGSAKLPPPCDGVWHSVGEVAHSLTHLDLQLAVQIALLESSVTPHRGQFVMPHQFCSKSLPTLMRKAHQVAASALAELASRMS